MSWLYIHKLTRLMGLHRRETSEERRERKAAKALSKEASRRANAEAALDLYGEGLGDSLGGSSQFVWHKKRQSDRAKGLSATEAQARDAARREEAQLEMEKLHRRRVERERDQDQREQEAARNAVASEDAAMRTWIAKEDEFYLEQSKKRAEIRVRERRAKPVDYLALNLKWSSKVPDPNDNEEDEGEGLDVDLEEPYAIFEVCSSFQHSRRRELTLVGYRTSRSRRLKILSKTSRCISPLNPIQPTSTFGALCCWFVPLP